MDDANGVMSQAGVWSAEQRAEVEVHGATYVVLRERDIHAVAAERLGDSPTGLYL